VSDSGAEEGSKQLLQLCTLMQQLESLGASSVIALVQKLRGARTSDIAVGDLFCSVSKRNLLV
jgi:hypothetical protein